MNNNINVGARVMSAAGEEIGVVDGVIESGVERTPDIVVGTGQHTIHVPWSAVDTARSSANELVLVAGFDASSGNLGAAEDGSHHTIEVLAEEARIDIVEVDRGRVTIDKTVERVPVQQDVELGVDTVQIERFPRDEEVDAMPQPLQEGDTLIIPVVEEFLVITRRYRIVEEVHVTRRRETHIERVEDELLREVLTVRDDADGNLIVEDEPSR